MSLDRASFPARTSLQATSLSRPPKLHPLTFRKPTLSGPTSEIRLLRDTSLVKDVMSLSKFFSSFKPAGRHRAAQHRYEQPGGSMARNVPAPVEPITLSVRSSPQVGRPLDDVQDMLANFRSRMWRTSSSPSSNCARMPTICEEFDAGKDAAASPSDRESLQTSAPVITGPVLKRRGGMSALTSLAEEEEEAEEEEDDAEYSSDAWDGYETDSPRSSFASDDSFTEKWSDALVPSSPSQKSSALLLSAQPVLLANLQFAAPQSDSEAHLQARLSEHHRLVRKEMSVGNRVLLRR